MNILFYNNVFLWNNQTITFFNLAKRFEKHKIFWLTCEKTLYTCPANSQKNQKTCKICLIKKKHFFDEVLNDSSEEIFLELKKYNNKKININSLKELKSFFYKNLPIGELAISQICDDLKADHVSEYYIKKNKERIINMVLNGISLFDETVKAIEQYKISKVYAWNGRRPSDGPVLYAAKHKKIKFKSLGSPSPQNYILSRGTKIHDLKEIVKKIKNFEKKNEKKKLINFKKSYQEFIFNKIYGNRNDKNYGSENIVNSFTKNFEIKDYKNLKNYNVFFSSSGYENAGFSDWDSKIYFDQYDCLNKIIKDHDKNTKLIIRWHPMLKKARSLELDRVSKIIKNSGENIIHIKYDDPVNSYDILKNAQKVILYGSTICFEANYYNKPIISLTTTPYDDLGIMYIPNTHDEFLELLKSDLKPKKNKKVYYYAHLEKSNFYNFIFKYTNYVNGEYFYKKLNIFKLSFLNRVKTFFIKLL